MNREKQFMIREKSLLVKLDEARKDERTRGKRGAKRVNKIINKLREIKKDHDENTIVWIDPDTPNWERKNYKKNHPGKRLSFAMRFPDAPLWIGGAAVIVSLISITIKAVKELI